MNRYKLSKAGIDANEGIRRFNNDKNMYEKFLKTFPENTLYHKLIEDLENKNVSDAFQSAHALKGLSGNLSLVQLYKDMIPLVEELRSGSLEKADSYLPSIKVSYDKIIKALEE